MRSKIISSFINLIVLALLLIGCQPVLAKVNPVADSIVLDVECAGGRMGRGKCPQGYELGLTGTISLAHLDNVSTSNEHYIEHKRVVDLALGGSPEYGYDAKDAVDIWYKTNNPAYLTFAIEGADSYVTSEEALIAGGSAANIANDSYLYVGPKLTKIALLYGMAYDQLTAGQRTRWAAYAEQVIFNVWNNSQAEWGGNSHTWSGWATNNPNNNYYFSFAMATSLWALASGNQIWLDKMNNEIIPALNTAYASIVGGGSIEGTGYGEALKNLFRLYHFWKSGTSASIDQGHNHTKESIDYMIHLTTPDFAAVTPIGDVARSSYMTIFDYETQLVLSAAALYPTSPEAARARWYAGNVTIPSGVGWKAREYLYDTTGVSTAPTALSYFAQTTGVYLAPSSWTPSAMLAAFKAGELIESHAHQDMGSVSLYKLGWLTVTGNRGSNGIKQSTDRHNIVRFERSGSILPQARDTPSAITPSDNAGTHTVVMDMSNLYSDSDITQWTRTAVFNGTTLTIDDVTVTDAAVTPIFQLNTDTLPIQTGNTITAGSLQIQINTPASPTVVIESWQTDIASDSNQHYRISISGGANFSIVLSEV